MGFFSNLKNKLGIGGVKVEVRAPGQVAKADGKISGTVVLTTKSDQEVVGIKVKVLEVFSTGRGNEKEVKNFTLGQVSLPGNFTIKTGESKEVPFSVSFVTINSNADDLKEKGGALGAIGKLGAFANAEKSEYYVEAEADVKAAALDPSGKQQIKMV
jgi:hypothetical protein